MYDLKAAKNFVLTNVLAYDQNDQESQRPAIFDERTLEYSFGWVFFYNNEAYVKDQRNPPWGGPGPILFNRYTGEVRQFNATHLGNEVAEDYAKELEAGAGCWTFYIDNVDVKTLALKLKDFFKISGPEAISLAKKSKGPIFRGTWRQVSEFAGQFGGGAVRLSELPLPEVPELLGLGAGEWKFK